MMESSDHGPEWVHWSAADLSEIETAKRAKGRRGKQRDPRPAVLDVLAALDVETSRLSGSVDSYIYHWQVQIGLEGPTIYGRTADELRSCLDRIAVRVPDNRRLVIYVHNLSYEFHFLRGLYEEVLAEDIFALDRRKILSWYLPGGNIELRCSYILTNMSLDQWTKKMGVEHRKKSPSSYDHSEQRYPWTPLTAEELEYCQNDVLGLVEALRVQLDLYGDTLATIPKTSTGYVRRDVKRVMHNWSFRQLQAVQPDTEVYVALREAFRGGDTHANRYYVGNIVEGVQSADRSSSYPDVCCNRMFPMGHLRTTDEPVGQLINRGRAVLVRIAFHSIRLRDPYDPCPYIAIAKCRNLQHLRGTEDNGRVMQAGYLEITLTDVDYKMISKQYTWESSEQLQCWHTYYDYLPDMLRNLIISYYRAKTEFKGVEGQQLYYDKAKALLNSIYGLQAQDPCRPHIEYQHHLAGDDMFKVTEGALEELLDKAKRSPYGAYQWGVWCTALAREELRAGIELVGDDFIYCDTDSVKYVGDHSFDEYNHEKIAASRESGSFARDPSGAVHYMGVFEPEGEYRRFVTYGAKKYSYERPDGSIGITIAGVGKRAGAEELRRAGGLGALKLGYTFRAAGGLQPLYNDSSRRTVHLPEGDINIYPNITLEPSTYTLGISESYEDVLRDRDLLDRMRHNQYITKRLTRW